MSARCVQVNTRPANFAFLFAYATLLYEILVVTEVLWCQVMMMLIIISCLSGQS